MHEHGTHDPARDLSAQLPTDPVCGMRVDPEDRPELHHVVEGRSYWFCGKGCLLEFREDPGRYLDPGYRPHM